MTKASFSCDLEADILPSEDGADDLVISIEINDYEAAKLPLKPLLAASLEFLESTQEAHEHANCLRAVAAECERLAGSIEADWEANNV